MVDGIAIDENEDPMARDDESSRANERARRITNGVKRKRLKQRDIEMKLKKRGVEAIENISRSFDTYNRIIAARFGIETDEGEQKEED